MTRLFVLGDSISIHYGPYLKRFVEGRFAYDRKRGDQALQDLDRPTGANGGDSAMVLDYLQTLLRDTVPFDLLLFNCGLHDIKTNPATGKRQVEPEKYRSNLQEACGLLHNKGAAWIWVRTTPVDDERHASYGRAFSRADRDVGEYNGIADEVMAGFGAPVIDLYGFSKSLGAEAYCDHVHYREDVRMAQAAYLAGFLTGRERGSNG